MKDKNIRELIDFAQGTGIVIEKLRNVINDYLSIGRVKDGEFTFHDSDEEDEVDISSIALGKRMADAEDEILDAIKYLTHNQNEYSRSTDIF